MNIKLNDITLNYEEKGRGFPLILLHGNGESLSYFKNQTDFFSKDYRVIALDTRGHGKSQRGAAPFTIRQFADDLRCFMEKMNIDKAHILGFSDGGNIAAVFALKYPEKVEKLILNGANLDASGVKGYFQIPITLAYRLMTFRKGFCEKRPANTDGRASARELFGLMVNEPYIRPEDLSQIKIPTLVIAGTRDLIKSRHTKLIASNIPGSALVFISGGHSIAKTRAAGFNAAVSRFLKGEVKK